MAYLVTNKGSFMEDFIRLDRGMQKRITSAIQELETGPDTPRGDTIKKLRYHEDLWRYRIADYRMVYAVYPEQKLVQVVGIGPRGEIYERMKYKPDAPDYPAFSRNLEKALNPNEETPQEWGEYLQRDADQQPKGGELPYLLTSSQLSAWQIPQDVHHYFVDCRTEEDLLNCGAPPAYFDKIMDLMYPADLEKMTSSPNYVLQKPEDLQRYADGDLVQFLLLLDKDQERFVNFSLDGPKQKGPTMIKGGAGSGKSTVALYRMQALARSAANQLVPPRILFTTYTNALISFSQQLLDSLLEGLPSCVDVSTADRIFMKIVWAQDRKHLNFPKPEHWKYALNSAKTHFASQGNHNLEVKLVSNAIGTLRNDYIQDEIDWVIEGRGISTEEEYLQVNRAGRGYAFNPAMRRAMWRIYEHVSAYFENLDKPVTTWGKLRMRALEILKAGQWENKWDYIMIDEAQDLTPVALAALVEACQSPAGIFLTADASQSLYNRGFSWKRVHESLRLVGRTRILRRNYRTTRQIALAASAFVNNGSAGDAEALDQVYVHVGPKPQLYAAPGEFEQYYWLMEQIKTVLRELRLPVSAAAVLSTSNDRAREIAAQLMDLGLPTRYMDSKSLDLQAPFVKSITIHSSKGLEFPVVAVPYVEQGTLPASLDERAGDFEEHLNHQRRLLYVACSRAMRRLLVSYRQGQISPFLEDMNLDLWQMGKLMK